VEKRTNFQENQKHSMGKLVTADQDGRAVTIATKTGESPGLITIGEADWR
jgi:hypothetical protein